MELDQQDIAELLVILNHALAEVNDDLSHEYVLALAREHAEKRREAIRKWIHRLSQHVR